MDQIRSDEPEGAPTCAQDAGADAPSGGAGPERRNSARRKLAAVLTVGHIGPLAVLPGNDMGEALRAVLHGALEVKSPQLSMVVPGRSERMQDAALELGFRIDEPFVLLSARPFGDWSHYLPSNPGFM
jgi:hypothetical protein